MSYASAYKTTNNDEHEDHAEARVTPGKVTLVGMSKATKKDLGLVKIRSGGDYKALDQRTQFESRISTFTAEGETETSFGVEAVLF